MKHLVALVLMILTGCSSPINDSRSSDTSREIKLVNYLIDSQADPANGRLSRDPQLNTVKIDGFNFMKGKNTADFFELLTVAHRTTGFELLERENLPPRMEIWIKTKDKSTVYFMLETDLWDFGDGSQAMDLLVFATDDASITDWGLFPLCPY